MDNNAKLEKLYAQLAAGASEKELDEMLDEETVGAGTPTIVIGITGIIVSATAGFDWCPTGACTYSCRV